MNTTLPRDLALLPASHSCSIVLATGIFPPDIGGPATSVPAVAQALSMRGHRVTVVTLSDVATHASDADYPFQVVRIARHQQRAGRLAQTVAQISQAARSCDALFVNGLQLEASIANQWLRKPLLMKVVGDLAWERARIWGATSHTFEAFQMSYPGGRVALLRALRGWWTRAASQVIVPSGYLARVVAGWGVAPHKIAVVYNGVTLPPKEPAALRWPAATPRYCVSVVARLVPWKRVGALIGAIARMPDVGLIVVGDGPQRTALEALATSCNAAERVFFAGACSRAQSIALVANSDLFVLPSVYEGLPHVVLEAMQCGTPVLATAVGGTPELIHDGVNGRLLAPYDDVALGSSIRALLDNPAERRRLAAGAVLGLEQFSHGQMLARTVALIEREAL